MSSTFAIHPKALHGLMETNVCKIPIQCCCSNVALMIFNGQKKYKKGIAEKSREPNHREKDER